MDMRWMRRDKNGIVLIFEPGDFLDDLTWMM
jgi:hypothetical protein